ncbi:hypothetical protein CDAR_407221 [Caerostris darwini]|uniref:Uncharacterized protein n=1 Tax=Caerostris darwini TaxID=1538125 RepID=A0AAV4PZ22_9ARAC|nr:hypothetical protein CDAR_407221 [Caerostris darwini]
MAFPIKRDAQQTHIIIYKEHVREEGFRLSLSDEQPAECVFRGSNGRNKPIKKMRFLHSDRDRQERKTKLRISDNDPRMQLMLMTYGESLLLLRKRLPARNPNFCELRSHWESESKASTLRSGVIFRPMTFKRQSSAGKRKNRYDTPMDLKWNPVDNEAGSSNREDAEEFSGRPPMAGLVGLNLHLLYHAHTHAK